MPIKCTFQQCIDYVDIARHSCTRGVIAASNKDGVGKTSYFRAKCLNILKIVGYTSKVTSLLRMTNLRVACAFD